LRNRAIRAACEGVQDREFVILIELEHYAATGMSEQEVLNACQVSAGLRYAVEVSVSILNERSDRISAVGTPGEFMEQ
jgi:hypothetical protein